MVARPIDEVRGTALKADPPALVLKTAPALPKTGSRAVEMLMLEQQSDGLRWTISFADGGEARADATTGALLPMIDANLAKAQAARAYKGSAKIIGAQYFAAKANPVDLRRDRPAWQIRLDDGTHLYVDAETARFLAIRTPQWRAFDWMWGWHIMDPGGREDTSHPLLILCAALAALAVFLAAVQLLLRLWPVRMRG